MKFSKIFNILMFLLLLINYHFFFLVNISNTIVEYVNLAITTVSFLVYLLLRNRDEEKLIFKPVIISLILISFIGHIYSIVIYPQEAMIVSLKFFRWSILLLYFPLSSYMRNNFRAFVSMLTTINIFANILLIIQSILLNKFSLMFLKFGHTFSDTGSLIVNTRDGSWRFTGIAIYTFISLLLSLYLLLKEKEYNEKGGIMHVVNSAVSFASIYLVVQTRSMNVTILISIFIIILVLWLDNIRSHTKFPFNKILFFLSFLIITISASYFLDFSFFISEFLSKNIIGRDDVSLHVRQGALKYYLSVALNNPLFGNGAFLGVGFDQAIMKERGPLYLYYYVDVGLVGNIGRFGFPILIPIFIYFQRMIKYIKKSGNISFSIFFIVTFIQIMTTYSYFVESLFFGLLIILAISESQLQCDRVRREF